MILFGETPKNIFQFRDNLYLVKYLLISKRIIQELHSKLYMNIRFLVNIQIDPNYADAVHNALSLPNFHSVLTIQNRQDFLDTQ